MLLFYDGFELRATEDRLAQAASRLRGAIRYLKRGIEGVQPATGLYVAFISLVRALRASGIEVRVNDFAFARAHPELPVGMFGYGPVLDWLSLPNPKVLGPGSFGDPKRFGALSRHKSVKAVIQACDWYREYHRPYCADNLVTWPVGIDVERYADASADDKTIDVLIYDKIRWNRPDAWDNVMSPFLFELQRRGLTYKFLLYGYHRHSKYVRLLRKARSMAFICEHESQGLACLEALSMNVPVFAWDEGRLVDPCEQPFASPGLAVTSVPYFDDRCGLRFKGETVAEDFSAFWSTLSGFRPRDYIIETLTPGQCAERYLAIYDRVATLR